MVVPEATVNEYRDADGWNYDVGFTGKRFNIEPKTNTLRTQERTHQLFGLGVCSVDVRHNSGAIRFGECISHLRKFYLIHLSTRLGL